MSGDNAIPSPNTLSTRVRGEAVTVDLGKAITVTQLR
jgi:hypothetical protein